MSRARAGVAVAVAVVVLVALVPVAAEAVVLDGYFVDDNGSVHETGIDTIAEAGITVGCNPPANDRFCPDRSVSRAEMAVFLARALRLSDDGGRDWFTDDTGSFAENAINRIAAAGITQGCNPPANTRYCPDRSVTRAEMAAFLARAFGFPATDTDWFIDDDGLVLEGAINRIAERRVTVGCNPPVNDRYCPSRDVTRAEMATFLTRAIPLTPAVIEIPIGDSDLLVCSKDGLSCTLTVDLSAGRRYRVQEGWYQVTPASPAEQAAFDDPGTGFELTRGGTAVALRRLPTTIEGNRAVKEWQSDLTFTAGTSTLVGRWRWEGDVARTATVLVRASD